MTHSTSSRRLGRAARTIGAVALAAGTLLGATSPASADTGSAKLFCYVGSANYTIGLPFVASPYYSRFYVSIDGGPWQTSNWFWSGNYRNYELTSLGWEYRSLIATGAVGGGHTVSAWEYRYYPNGATGWTNLGTCTTSSFDFGGIIFTH